VPIVELSLGEVVVPGDAGVPLMLPLLGAVLSVVLGDVVVPGEVVVPGDVVELGAVRSLGDVLGVVGFGDVVFGDCAPGPAAPLGVVLLPESLPLVCA
jgi:hypothetical protein